MALNNAMWSYIPKTNYSARTIDHQVLFSIQDDYNEADLTFDLIAVDVNTINYIQVLQNVMHLQPEQIINIFHII